MAIVWDPKYWGSYYVTSTYAEMPISDFGVVNPKRRRIRRRRRARARELTPGLSLSPEMLPGILNKLPPQVRLQAALALPAIMSRAKKWEDMRRQLGISRPGIERKISAAISSEELQVARKASSPYYSRKPIRHLKQEMIADRLEEDMDEDELDGWVAAGTTLATVAAPYLAPGDDDDDDEGYSEEEVRAREEAAYKAARPRVRKRVKARIKARRKAARAAGGVPGAPAESSPIVKYALPAGIAYLIATVL